MRQEYEPQDLIKERSHPLDLRPNGSVSQAQHIALVPLLYLKQVFFPVWMVVLSRVRRWWHHPIVGYLIALLSQAIAVIIVLLLIHVFPNFAILGLLLILATLVVSLGWGAGPSLFTALVSTALFNYFLLSPQFTWSFQNPQQVIETSIFLLVGITISLLASRAKNARLEAEANRSRLENLVVQLQEEQEALRQAKKEADAQAHQLEETLSALRKSEARFRRLFDANILGIHFANVNGTVTESNDTFLQMVGFTHKEVQEGSLRWNEITSAEYREADKQAIAQLRATGVCAPFEKEYLRRDGIRVSILVGIALLEG